MTLKTIGGDDLLADYDTVATAPIRSSISPERTVALPDQSTYITQPTQKLDQSQQRRTASPGVQVAASSPITQSPIPPRVRPSNRGSSVGISIMAPPGTQFRHPSQQLQNNHNTQKSQTLEFSDDERKIDYSSDEELDDSPARSEIKPATFSRGGKPIDQSRVDESPKTGLDLSQFRYAAASPQKRPADAMADAYSNSRRPAKVRQTGPAKAMPVEDISLEDIMDADIRGKIKDIQMVLPNESVASCQRALYKKGGNYHDAMDLLVIESKEEDDTTGAKAATQTKKHSQAIDLTLSEDEMLKQDKTKPEIKRHVNAPSQTIKNKWSTTRKEVPRVNNDAAARGESSSTTQVKPKKRLVQGRKVSTARSLSSSPPPKPPQVRAPSYQKAVKADEKEDEEEEMEDESSAESDEEEEISEADFERARNLLNFINTCTRDDLFDVSNQSAETVDEVLDKRPFDSLDDVRAITIFKTTKAKNGKARTSTRAVGEKLVDACLEMWTGYEAVDQLVAKCDELGKPIAAVMKKWSKQSGRENSGELEILEFDSMRSSVSHDSGIGTPSSSVASGEDEKSESAKKEKPETPALLQQPTLMNTDIKMKDYQVVGLNWLSLLFSQKLSCILADDMGLGKTCQVIAFLAHLYETGVSGPHLIIVPGSTLENWLREFDRMCPALEVIPYYGEQKERAEIRAEIEDRMKEINVILTTYETATKPTDASFLRSVKPVVCVYDEGHYLKNSQTDRYKKLMRLSGKFRLLLTGTPLQNNLQELIALLAFILPQLFDNRQDDLRFIFKHKAKTTDKDHAALLSAERVNRARSMMTPFVLRRKKHQVLKLLPKKTSRVEYCDLTDSQKSIYEQEVAKVRKALVEDSSEGENKTTKPSSTDAATQKTNVLMDLRKAAIHPLLFRRRFDDATLHKMSHACLKEAAFRQSDVDYVYEDMTVMTDFELDRFCFDYPKTMRSFRLKDEPCMDSGKVQTFITILKAFHSNGDRALVFSQFRIVMDILEKALESAELPYCRLDGVTKMNERQDLIDQFHKDTSIPVFLLSTKAGGAGINLECANKVVIFDSSFNPQDDIQAENRAHRVGQTRDVEVVRLVSRGTIEEQILTLGQSKLALDQKVAGDDEPDAEMETKGLAMVRDLVVQDLSGAPADADEAICLADRPGSAKSAHPADLKQQFLSGLEANGLDLSAA